MSKTILAKVDGFTPLIDNVVSEFGVMEAAVFGRIWRYCQGERGVCYASIETIATELGISRQTVVTHIRKLTSGGYLQDLTPNRTGSPHVYRDTGKAGITIKLGVENLEGSNYQPLQNLEEPLQILEETPLKFRGKDTIRNKEETTIQQTSFVDGDTSSPDCNPQPPKVNLLPETPGAQKLFNKLACEFAAKGRKAPKKFQSLESKNSFVDAENKCTPDELDAYITAAMKAGATSTTSAVNYIVGCSKKQPKPQYQQQCAEQPARRNQRMPEIVS